MFLKFIVPFYEMLCHTEAFKLIPKTEDFEVLCIDHDEDLEDVMKNTKKTGLLRVQQTSGTDRGILIWTKINHT